MQSVIDDNPELVEKTARALLKGVAYLQDDKDAAVKMIADINRSTAERRRKGVGERLQAALAHRRR